MPDFLVWLASGSSTTDCHLLVVAAHPDDETIGLGAQLRRLPRARILQVTDGTPRSGFDPRLERVSPGMLLVGQAVEAAFAEGMAHADFLRGRETYKYFWGAEDCPTFRRCLTIRGGD